MLRDLQLKDPGTAQLMIIINSEQVLTQQPAGSGRMPRSPTVRFEKIRPIAATRGWKGGDNEKEGAGQCQGGGAMRTGWLAGIERHTAIGP